LRASVARAHPRSRCERRGRRTNSPAPAGRATLVTHPTQTCGTVGDIVDLSGWRVATPARVGPRARVLVGGLGNHNPVPTRETRVREVKALKTRAGNTRFVLVDEDGNEYTTFKEPVAAKLPGLEGRRARIEFHEQERNGFTNVYLDDVTPLDEAAEQHGEGTAPADEVAWKTAVDAAPYLLDAEAVEEEVPPEELFAKLQPFKQLVADDIESGDDGA
jgi:hypothetical protein